MIHQCNYLEAAVTPISNRFLTYSVLNWRFVVFVECIVHIVLDVLS